jgi:hypothetical protein
LDWNSWQLRSSDRFAWLERSTQTRSRPAIDERPIHEHRKRAVDQRVAKIEATLQQLANVVVMTARQDERLIAIERRVDRLEQASTVKH